MKRMIEMVSTGTDGRKIGELSFEIEVIEDDIMPNDIIDKIVQNYSWKIKSPKIIDEMVVEVEDAVRKYNLPNYRDKKIGNLLK